MLGIENGEQLPNDREMEEIGCYDSGYKWHVESQKEDYNWYYSGRLENVNQKCNLTMSTT